MASLLEQLQSYAREEWTPFHMPGHKRNAELAPYIRDLGAAWDITEIEGFDDLHHPEGALQDAMERAARVWGSDRTFFLVGGSSAGILAGVRAATRRGDRVLVGRNCHKSIYHALELCGLNPVFLQPNFVPEWNFFASLTPQMVENALAEHPECTLLILTSPTYEGVCSDVAEICQVAHRRGVPVLVDAAHGAHLGFSAGFPNGAVEAGADLVIQSTHKTLPSLTQTALAHVNGDLVSSAELARQLGVFQSSSPSYLLMASLDGCVRLMEERGTQLMGQWEANLAAFDQSIAGLRHLKVFGHGSLAGKRPSGVFAWDPSKLIISTRRSALSGVQLERRLRQDYHIELEMCLEEYATAMTGLGTTGADLDRLARALVELDEMAGPGAPAPVSQPEGIPERRVFLALAAEEPWELVTQEQAAGRAAAEYLWAYPPGIPLITPGEVFSQGLLDRLAGMGTAGVNLLGTRGDPPRTLAVLQKEKNPS